MTRHTMWRTAGAVAALMLGAAVRPSTAAAAAWPVPLASASIPGTAAATSDSPFCITEAAAYGAAVGTYVKAWDAYNTAVQNDDAAAILAAATNIDKATLAVIDSGLLLLNCLLAYL